MYASPFVLAGDVRLRSELGLASYSALLDDAKDSPLVDGEGDDKQLFFGLMGTYRWGSK